MSFTLKNNEYNTLFCKAKQFSGLYNTCDNIDEQLIKYIYYFQKQKHFNFKIYY
jgi:hypothetical protein